MNNVVTYSRVANGQFDVLLDGNKTGYGIVNGSLGLSGHGKNLYGITKGDAVRWVGTLQACKKILKYSLTKGAR